MFSNRLVAFSFPRLSSTIMAPVCCYHASDYAVITERLLSRLMTPFNYPAGGVPAKLVQYIVHDRASVASYSSFLCFR